MVVTDKNYVVMYIYIWEMYKYIHIYIYSLFKA